MGDLPSIYDRRLAACGKLESAETNLLRTALKIRKKNLKQGKRTDGVDDADQAERDVALAERLVPKDRRPTHRLPAGFLPFSLPFIGEKVDTIDWSRNEISECSALLRTARQTADRESNIPALEDKDDDGRIDRKDLPTQTYRPLNSAFVTFNQQLSAHLAYHALTHHEPYRMADRYLEVSPEDVIWGNLGLNPYEKRVRMAISYAATAALIIFWAIPVAFVGIISNIHGLCVRYSWLAWLCKIPAPIIGIIQGILPAVLLAVLNMLLPIVLRLFGRFQGIPTRTGLELSLMTRFFIFQVIVCICSPCNTRTSLLFLLALVLNCHFEFWDYRCAPCAPEKPKLGGVFVGLLPPSGIYLFPHVRRFVLCETCLTYFHIGTSSFRAFLVRQAASSASSSWRFTTSSFSFWVVPLVLSTISSLDQGLCSGVPCSL